MSKRPSILADTVLREADGMSVTAFAEKLGMTRTAISLIIHGKAAISMDMSIRLEEALGTSAETWLAMQAAYDLWQAKSRSDDAVQITDRLARSSTCGRKWNF